MTTDISAPNLSSTQQRQQAPVSPNNEFGVVAEGARASTPFADFGSAPIDEWGGQTVTRAEADFLERLSANQSGDVFSEWSGNDGGRNGQAVDELRFQQSTGSTHSRSRSRSTSSHSSQLINSRSVSRSSSSEASDDGMARPHFEKPPVFRGLEGDDPIEWVERYEEAATINNWNDAARAANMIRSLEGPARK